MEIFSALYPPSGMIVKAILTAMPRLLSCLLPALTLLGFTPAWCHDFPQGEARLTHPISLTPDGTRLLVLNAVEGRLSVFDLRVTPAVAVPPLVQEIPVGLSPVSVRARTNDEIWVVNEGSDSLSIVSLERALVVRTLAVPDEPADVVFAAGQAWVSCAGSDLVRSFDLATLAPGPVIPLNGKFPRSLTVSGDGTKVYVAFQNSGNGSTVLPADQAPDPPAPLNPATPPAPKTALIVGTPDARIPWTVLDHDVAEILTATGSVSRYFGGLGTSLFDAVLQPGTDFLWVPHTEARNTVRFESNLVGHPVDHRLSRLNLTDRSVQIHDLNPGTNYSQLPNPTAAAIALAQPMAMVFQPDGAAAWVAAYGSDRIARVDPASGAVLARIDLRGPGSMTLNVPIPLRGPRGLVLDAARQRLYVLNKISLTLSVIDTAQDRLLAETPAAAYNAMDPDVNEGRALFTDARLSGNGLVSCAVCHIDADRDGLAWDLGNPAGSLLTVSGANLAAGQSTRVARVLHPMKGPMVTRSLRGLHRGTPLQWRGDKDLAYDYEDKFTGLLGAAVPAFSSLTSLDLYFNSTRSNPNPNRTLSDQLPATYQGANPERGRLLFAQPSNRCLPCHSGPTGSDNNIDDFTLIGATGPLLNPSFENLSRRQGFSRQPGASSVMGFGFGHDGTADTLPFAHPVAGSSLAAPADLADVAAWLLCFSSGTPPAVGAHLTVAAADAQTPAVAATLQEMENQAALSACDLIVQGRIHGVSRAFLFDGFDRVYNTDTLTPATLTRSALLALIQGDSALSWLGVYAGTGRTRGGNRDNDGYPDLLEQTPIVVPSWQGGSLRADWTATDPHWFVETAPTPAGPWQAAATIPQESAGHYHATLSPAPGLSRLFLRLRRTW